MRPDGRHLFVHGDVFSDRIRVVLVSLKVSSGRTVDIRTVSLPGGSTAFRIGSVNRFDIRFDRPDSPSDGSLIVQASGYDAADDRIVSVEVRAGSPAR